MKRLFAFTLLVSVLLPVAALAQHPVFVVRHAERADAGMATATSMANDPELSEAGKARAQSLATLLKDAGVTAIFVTEFKRTQQTAEPLAKALGIQPTVLSVKDAASVVEKIRAANGAALIVGHSNTVPDVLTRLGIANPPKLGDADYDNLFVVTGGDKPALIRLHYR
jgi:broad specificity phosphatase PhoE